MTSFEEIFQGWLEKEEYNKNKGFLKKSKFWKKYFCVLRRYEGDSNVYLQWFEKEEEWRKEFPKGSFGLFPKYSVYKHKTEKGKCYFEVSNDEEAHYLMANNEVTMDLWVIQLMMQTRLSSSMIETSFRVKGGDSKCLQRIGAKNLNCLLHISEWGMTVALERTHSVLSQWPLTTIRNYECTDNNEFVFEAGRKSPMGEGKYEFHTNNGEDNAIFDQLDRFTTLRAGRVRSSGGRNRLQSANDDEIAQAYQQLRWSVMLTRSTLNLGVIHGIPSQPQAIVQTNNHQVYNHLDRKPSIQSTAIGESYDRLDRTGSLNDHLDRTYSRLNCNNSLPNRTPPNRTPPNRTPPNRTPPNRTQSQRSMREQNMSDSYDHLERAPSFTGSPSSADSRSRSFGSVEGRSRFQFSSPPPEDSYNHLSRYRHASMPSSSSSPRRNMEFYDKLDRSMVSVNQETFANSYDRLNSVDRGMATSPPVLSPSNDSAAVYDVFGNVKGHNPTLYEFTNHEDKRMVHQEPLVVDLPPPLPEKPSFMVKCEKNPSGPLSPSSTVMTSPRQPLPPPLNGADRPERCTSKSNQDFPRDIPSNGLQTQTNGGNTGSHYQSVDNEEKENVENHGSHYQTVHDQKQEYDASREGSFYQDIDNNRSKHGVSTGENNSMHYQSIDEGRSEPEYAEPRGSVNTHSSDPDLLMSTRGKGKGKLDPSKRTTLHRSAPSLALYSLVEKKGKGSLKGTTKSGSTFKLFKKLGRSSKKASEEESQEKIPRKSKKSQKKDNHVVSTSSLQPLILEGTDPSYVDVDGEESAQARQLAERRDSKRPLPDVPADTSVLV